MSGEFIEKARGLESVPPGDKDALLDLLQVECWPEILAVVEGAELWAEKGGYRTDEDGLLVSLSLRLHVLDEKARKL